MNVGPCLGWGCTTSGSITELGRVRGAGCGELGAATLLLTDESMDVGGGSCGGEIWGVIKAGSLRFVLSAPLVGLSSREDVPAGVNGGDCMAWATDVRCWEDWPEVVREAGEGEGAWSCQLLARYRSERLFAYS